MATQPVFFGRGGRGVDWGLLDAPVILPTVSNCFHGIPKFGGTPTNHPPHINNFIHIFVANSRRQRSVFFGDSLERERHRVVVPLQRAFGDVRILPPFFSSRKGPLRPGGQRHFCFWEFFSSWMPWRRRRA